MREFLHLDDLAEPCVFALENFYTDIGDPPYMNVVTGINCTIGDLAKVAAAATGYQGSIYLDTSKSDGTPKKQLDVSRQIGLGRCALISLGEGMASTVTLFREELSQESLRL